MGGRERERERERERKRERERERRLDLKPGEHYVKEMGFF